jgi:VanZ family protein
MWGPPVLYMVLIFYSSSQSDPAPAVTQVVWDKLLHLGGYALLALFFARALRSEGAGRLVTTVAAIVLTSVYGASDEWHQMFTPMRDSDIRDWLADTLGAAIGALAYALLAARSTIGVHHHDE